MSPRLPHAKDSQIAVPLATSVGPVAAADDFLRLLCDAGAVLSAAGDEPSLCGALARLAVPNLADWCAVDLVDGSPELRRVAVAHQDPAMESRLRDSALRAPARLDEPFGIGKVARSAERELIADVDDAALAIIAQQPEQLSLWRTLGLRARLILPLRWGDVVVGTMLLAQSGPARRFDDQTIAVAEELARVAALSLANARGAREAREAREALDETQRELAESTERLEETVRRLAEVSQLADEARLLASEASQAKGQFLARMSHELRTPLNAIGGYAQLLEMGVRGPMTAPQREDLLRIQRSQRHLLSLVNDVLNFAKLQTGHVAFDAAPVPVATIVGDVTALVEAQLREKQLRLELDGMDSQQVALADAEKVRQILLNLLSNAVKFTSPGGRLRICIDGDAESVRIGVQDSGIGLPQDKLEAVFEPFVQLSEPLAGVPQGAGLSLAISRDLARGMGGELQVESEPGAGSIFTLSLKRAGADRRRGTAASTAASAVASPPASSRREPAPLMERP